MQNTQHTTGAYRYSWEIECTDYSIPSITLSNNKVLELELWQDYEHGWLVYSSSFLHILMGDSYKGYDPNFCILDYMEKLGVTLGRERLKKGRDYVIVYDENSKDILLTPRGVKELMVAFPITENQIEDTFIIYHWVNDYTFLGDYAKETIIKAQNELIASNGDGWMLNSVQLAKALGVKADYIRNVKSRHIGKLIEGVHWKYSLNGHKTLVFTKIGCLVMSSIIHTEEAKNTLNFLERVFGVTNKELSLAA